MPGSNTPTHTAGVCAKEILEVIETSQLANHWCVEEMVSVTRDIIVNHFPAMVIETLTAVEEEETQIPKKSSVAERAAQLLKDADTTVKTPKKSSAEERTAQLLEAVDTEVKTPKKSSAAERAAQLLKDADTKVKTPKKSSAAERAAQLLSTVGSAAPKKRGRPLGSKNSPKVPASDTEQVKKRGSPKGSHKKCGLCGEIGHNKRTCPTCIDF